MPLVNLIFFPEPVERTEAQIEEARLLGHIRETGPSSQAAGETGPSSQAAGEPRGGTDNEAGESGDDTEETP